MRKLADIGCVGFLVAVVGCGGSTPLAGEQTCRPGIDPFCTAGGTPPPGATLDGGGGGSGGGGGGGTGGGSGGGGGTTDAGIPPVVTHDAGIAPPPIDAGGAVGTNNCESVYSCVRACRNDACRQRCVAGGSAEGQSEFQTLWACPLTPNCDDLMCRTATCPDAVVACYDVNPRTGTTSCQELVDCDMNCRNNPSCRIGCFFKGTAQAQTDYGDLYKCYLENQCDDTACLRQYCQDSYVRCFNVMTVDGGVVAPDAGSLSLSCNNVLQCWSGCLDGQCVWDCVLSASPGGWTYLSPLMTCANNSNCEGADWFNCIQTECPTQYSACAAN